MGLFSKRKGIVGLDIGSSAIKACELKPTKNGYEVVTLGIEPLAPEAIVDGTILDSAVVIDAITNLFQENRIKTKDVATAVSGNSVIIRKITLPAMTEEELAESIQWEAEQYIPFDIEDVNIDYQILGQTAENMDVLLVAVKKDKINDYTQVISQAGLNPVLVAVDAFAMQRAFEANNDPGPDDVIALVNSGASITNINVIRGGTSLFWRDISSGGNKYTEEIQRELHVSQEQAEALKRGEAVEGVPSGNVQPIIERVTGEIATEIQKTFDFFMATSGTERIHRIVMSGGTSKIAALETILGERFGAQVEVLNPFEQVALTGKGIDADQAAADANQYGIAVGLGLRSPTDSGINLLREKRSGGGKKSAAAVSSGGGFQPVHLAFIGILALALGWVGFKYVKLTGDINRLTTKKSALELEKKRLEPILQEKADLEKKREALDRKITVIRQLKTLQQVPVRLLDELSRNLPEYVWLQGVSEVNQTITISGYALNANKVADFVETLNRSGLFKVLDPGPVYTALASSESRDQVSFRLVTQFTLPVPAGTEAGEPSTTAQAGTGN